ncbi:hypothetical protein O1L44_25365 [Streptomyces noursei]|nr:hypothetical protein [Streptomyces noursei]
MAGPACPVPPDADEAQYAAPPPATSTAPATDAITRGVRRPRRVGRGDWGVSWF